MKRIKLLLTLCVALVALGALCGGALAAEEYKFKMATFYLKGDSAFDVIDHFRQLVWKKTGGKVRIDAFQAGELGFPVTEILEATSRGVVEMSIFYPNYKVAQDPVMALAGGRPGPMFDLRDQKAQVDATKDLLERSFGRFGVRYIAPMVYGEPEILVSRRPMSSLKDLKGRIFRASGMAAEFYTAIGAQAMMLPAGELYQALQLGTIDGLEWTDYTANYKLGFHEVAKNVLEPTKGVNLHSEATVHAFLVVNPKVWEKLPKEHQKAIQEACDEAYKWGADHLAKLNKTYKDKWIKAGAKVTQLPKEDQDKVIEVSAKILSGYSAKSPDAKEYCRRLVELWKKLGYTKWSDALAKQIK
ncbi:TRAP transporter substrate-binding protein [Thermanaerovibrio acidaminovorans]|uniref:TRAP transporter substrate-binding protein n=1 Tax=Thermanaerovibrio acidaminovorans TaxID=81462 RepID=UPI002490A360|nr:TRAP transporter substrate-binding protein [Thermanaerovibrio acidaminovorans]